MAPGSLGNREAGRPMANLLAFHTVCGVAVVRQELQLSLFAFLIHLKYQERAALAEASREGSKRLFLEHLSSEL